MKFREKLIVVEAEQWFPDHPIEGVIPSYPCSGVLNPGVPQQHGRLDGHLVSSGDWVITAASGQRSLCKPDVFEAKYDPYKKDHIA